MINLGNRLKTAAQFARKGKSICDIGTDHAFLPVYLISNNISTKALACDLRKGPLYNAEKTVKQYNLTSKIELRISDGFDNVSPNEAEDFFVCGMGGTLIAKLLERANWLKDSKYRLILQPQSHSEEVRNFLIKNGFEILEEASCKETDKYYNIMVAEYYGKVKEYPIWYPYFGNLIYNDDEISKVVNNQVLNLLKIKCEAEKNYYSAEKYLELKNVIEEAEVILNGSNN